VTLAAGTRLGPYEVIAPLGAGGMGEVYRARDRRLDRDVAVKVLPEAVSNDARALARFEKEAKAVAALSHPNILAIHDFGSQEGLAFAVMELLVGETLRDRLNLGRIPQRQAVDLASQIAKGLVAAHEKGVVHRDLKPENIFLTKDGHLKILDFGLAKRVENVGSAGEDLSTSTWAGQTDPGGVVGTVGYMSPEQVRGLPVDHRTDIFSFGAVLYEMLSGRRAFKKETAADTISAILKEEPPELSGSDAKVPPALEGVVRHCLEKDRDHRFQSVRDVAFALAESQEPGAARHAARTRRRSLGRRVILIGAVLAAAALLAAWLLRRGGRERWVRDTAIPEITRLVEGSDFARAADLIREARRILPKDPTLERLWLAASGDATFESTPSGAEVSCRPYGADSAPWQPLGETPLEEVRVARSGAVYRLSKSGFEPVTLIDYPVIHWSITLPEKGTVPAGMVPVAEGSGGLGWPMSDSPGVELPGFFIDRTEVTNEAYQKFVDAGGYERPEYWKQPFLESDGRQVDWRSAVARFRDSTGRPGPSTWEAGAFPTGQGRYPVSGVSWFEAAAYAEFAGKALPTAYHWDLAAQTYCSTLFVPGSNFAKSGPREVGAPGSFSGFGTSDMAGNVKEWCWNESWERKRFLLGGSFGDPFYMFAYSNSESPWERRPTHGFRCVKLRGSPPEAAFGKLEPLLRDYWKEQPVSDEVFAAFKSLHAYDKEPLNSKLEQETPMEGWVYQSVTFDAAYGGERVPVHLFLPKNAAPPYQAVLYFPGGGVFQAPEFSPSTITDEGLDFVPRSGRALIYPVYRGHYHRSDGAGITGKPRAKWRDRAIIFSKDLGRTIDYLETRQDIDSKRLAYLGYSAGGALAPMLLAVEPRIQAAVLKDGGFWFRDPLPEVDWINYVTRVKTPLLMLNSRFDNYFPLESSQRPLFERVATPARDKKHVLFESSHGALPQREVVRETLDWLDKYLGPVRR
jgi:formylglycine-generating enzyme required for sulfatase activity